MTSVDYSRWRPQTDTTLDLRLLSSRTSDEDDTLLAKMASEMGKKLQVVETQGSFLSKKALNVLQESCTDLRKLNLCCAHAVGDTALEVISQCKELRDLDLHFARDEATYMEFLGFSTCRVDSSNLSKVKRITDAGIEKVLNGCEKLESLDLSGTEITVRTLDLVNSKKSVTFLRIHSCWNLKKEEIEEFKTRARPDLKITTDDTRATQEYEKLIQGVKPRYYQETKREDRSFKVGFKDGVAEADKPFINPLVFVDNLR